MAIAYFDSEIDYERFTELHWDASMTLMSELGDLFHDFWTGGQGDRVHTMTVGIHYKGRAWDCDTDASLTICMEPLGPGFALVWVPLIQTEVDYTDRTRHGLHPIQNYEDAFEYVMRFSDSDSLVREVHTLLELAHDEVASMLMDE